MSDTRTRLIKTAADLFLHKGYGTVGTQHICTNAKVNKGTFYHFFPSKSALLVAAIETYAVSFNDLFEGIARSEAPVAEKLVSLFEVPCEANRRWYSANGFAQGCLVGNMALELATVDPDVCQAANAALSLWSKSVEPIVAEFAGSEMLGDLDPAEGARCIIAMIQGSLLMAKANNDPELIAALAPAASGALRSLADST